MAARAVIRDVGRGLNYPYAEVDSIAKMIPFELGMTIEKAINMNNELRKAYEENERVKLLIDISKTLEGLPRHSSTHAAGVVIAAAPVDEYVPLAKNEDTIVTQFPMGTLEELGLLKMDFLGLRTLTVIRDALELIKEDKGIEIDLDKLPYGDPEVYKMISDGNTQGIFQLESAGMTQFMKELKPDCFEDIIAGISLYRPGPMAEIPRYIENKRNTEKVKYLTPQLKPILEVTYGCMVYQEQVMEIVRKLGGYSLGRSDLVRRAMSKKKHKVMEEERKNFIYGIVDEKGNIVVPGAVRNGVSEKAANEIFDQMMDFASYAFNKSHAAAYAVVGYQTAYLKRYYPVEFLAAMLTSVMGNNDKIAFYIETCKKMSIEVLPPDINESNVTFTVSGSRIRFGLAAIKNVGRSAMVSIIKARKQKGRFNSFTEFCQKVCDGDINKRAVESLIKAGAFDSIGCYRSQLLAIYEQVMDGIWGDRKRNLDGQLSLFDLGGSKIDTSKDILPDVKEFEKRHLLAMEKEMTGMYLSGHPLSEYIDELEAITTIDTSQILGNVSAEEDAALEQGVHLDNKIVTMGGIMTTVRIKATKSNSIMAFVMIEDMYGSIEVLIFPKVYEKYSRLVQEDSFVTIKGRLSVREDEAPKLLAEEIKPLGKWNNNLKDESSLKLYLKIQSDRYREIIEALKPILNSTRGTTPVYLCLEDGISMKRQVKIASKEMWVEINQDLILRLKNLLGEESVKVC